LLKIKVDQKIVKWKSSQSEKSRFVNPEN